MESNSKGTEGGGPSLRKGLCRGLYAEVAEQVVASGKSGLGRGVRGVRIDCLLEVADGLVQVRFGHLRWKYEPRTYASYAAGLTAGRSAVSWARSCGVIEAPIWPATDLATSACRSRMPLSSPS